MMKKKIIFYLALSLGAAIFLLYGQERKTKVDWERIKEAGETYFACPSSENALKLYLSLPEEDIGNRRSEGSKVIFFIFDNKNLNILEKHIHESDRNAVKAGFRLFNISDGWYAHRLDIALGDLIRINTKLFLEELKNHRNIAFVIRRGPPVYPVGDEYVDNFEARKSEIKLRIKAFESIKDKDLIEIRDECIENLKKFLKFLR
jgi:hypothetical protein